MALALRPNDVDLVEERGMARITSNTPGEPAAPSRAVEADHSEKMEGMVEGVDRNTACSDEQEKRRFESIRGLMFPDGTDQDDEDVEYSDNWNERFQKALDLPEGTVEECYRKWQRLIAVNRDFVATAVTYGKTIISEYFLPDGDKSIHRNCKVGGQAGGKKFLWRGILFKLADGSTGPYYGNDEAAAKGAGHDLRGATHYLGTRIKTLHYALQCLIDYLGFRMTAQAELPVDSSTLRYGTADAAKTVHNMDSELERKLQAVAKKLNLRTHMVGGKEMHSACDIEGHKGKDNRHYLLDFARSFPPESPFKVEHLSTILNNGTPVCLDLRSFLESGDVDGGRSPQFWGMEEANKKLPGVITKAYVPLNKPTLSEENIEYLVRLIGGKEVRVPSSRVKDRHLCIYWRMLRPEFIKEFGETPEEETEGTDGSQTPTTLNTPATATPPPPAGARGIGSVYRYRFPDTKPNLETIYSEVSHDEGSVISARMSRSALAPTPERPEALGVSRSVHEGGDYTGYDSESEDMTSTDEPSPPDLERLPSSAAGWRTPHFDERRQEQKEDRDEGNNNDANAANAANVIPIRNASPSSAISAVDGDDDGRRAEMTNIPMNPGRAPISRLGATRKLDCYSSPQRSSISVQRSSTMPIVPSPVLFRKDGNVSNDMSAPSDCGCSRYEVFSRFNRKSQREEGLNAYNRESSRKLIMSFNNSPSCRSIYMSTSIRVPRGDGTLIRGGGSRFGNYEVLEPTGRLQHPWAMGFLSRRDLSVGSGSVGGGAGGASGRAGPRTIFVEGTGSSGSLSLSYRFYPEKDQEETKNEDVSDTSGKRRYLGEDINAGRCLAGIKEGCRGVGRGIGENRSDRWELIPLSPDALSGFSKEDPNVLDRNQEVHDATGVLIDKVIPHLAGQLERMDLYDQGTLDLAIEMHRHGVNIRHLGKLREEVGDEFGLLKEMILTEMVARTLKNILRSYQREWMKAKRSTSDQGMRKLVVNFLNLVTGAHENHKEFWEREVTVGLLQRFGICALSDQERRYLECTCTSHPSVLKACVGKLVEMQGLVLIPAAEKFFESDENPKGFGFVVADIQEIRPIVRYMHILDYGGGVMLSMQAKKRQHKMGSHDRIAKRLNWQAMQHFRAAYQSMPDDQATRTALLSYSPSNGFGGLTEPSPRPSPSTSSFPCVQPTLPDPIFEAPGSIAKRFCSCFCRISFFGGGILPCPRPIAREGPVRIAPRMSITSDPSGASPASGVSRPSNGSSVCHTMIHQMAASPTDDKEDPGPLPEHCPGYMLHEERGC